MTYPMGAIELTPINGQRTLLGRTNNIICKDTTSDPMSTIGLTHINPITLPPCPLEERTSSITSYVTLVTQWAP